MVCISSKCSIPSIFKHILYRIKWKEFFFPRWHLFPCLNHFNKNKHPKACCKFALLLSHMLLALWGKFSAGERTSGITSRLSLWDQAPTLVSPKLQEELNNSLTDFHLVAFSAFRDFLNRPGGPGLPMLITSHWWCSSSAVASIHWQRKALHAQACSSGSAPVLPSFPPLHTSSGCRALFLQTVQAPVRAPPLPGIPWDTHSSWFHTFLGSSFFFQISASHGALLGWLTGPISQYFLLLF